MKSPLWAAGFLLSFFLSAPGFSQPSAAEGIAPPGSSQQAAKPLAASSAPETTIPGPLLSFQRMAGISRKAPPEEVLPLLAHEMNERGYDHHQPTEYLLLVRRYLQQARELAELAGPEAVIRVSNCDDAGPLLAILGYQFRDACGPDTTLQVADSGKAFLTSDSGFPLAAFEEAIRAGKPFTLPYPSSRVPVLFAVSDWVNSTQKTKSTNAQSDPKIDVVDILLHSPAVARLYSAFAGMDSETAVALRQSLGLQKLVRFAKELDFYGGPICIRSGKVLVPGGPSAEPAWKDLAGADPRSPGEFVARLMTADSGWLGSYFDALSYAGAEQQAYLTEPPRLQRFYSALRGRSPSPGPARAIFRSDPDFWLLVARLHLESGQPAVPGNLDVWREILHRDRLMPRDREWAARAEKWQRPEQLLEAMFALSRDVRSQSLDIYLTLSEIDRRRAPQEHLSPATVKLLANRFWRLGDQYSVFSEFPGLNDESVTAFVKAADALDSIEAPVVRANAIGIFQSNLGLWQILARQGEISTASWNQSWQHVIAPFAEAHTSAQLFDAGRASLRELLAAAAGTADLSQDELIELLAGPNLVTRPAQNARSELARKIRSAMDSQRLVSLDTLFALGTGLEQLAQGKTTPESLVPLAAQLREFELPRPIFARTLQDVQSGRLESSDVRHTTLQTRTDLQKIIRSGSAKEREDARGRLAPFLRDTLVGLNYTYYSPPGSQMLFNNAVFVRSHDYSDSWETKQVQPWTAPRLVNLASSAGGGHLAGSLLGLPYALALVEQNFIVPENVQSLIWEDFVPTLLTSAVLPRFWGVTESELHAVALYQRAGEELLRAAAENEKLRGMVFEILSERMPPQKSGLIEMDLRGGRLQDAVSQLLPGEAFYLASEFRRRFPQETAKAEGAVKELEELAHRYPQEVSGERLAHDFGVPHPTLARTYALDLPSLKPFPTFVNYSSRLMAECWDSNNLYWARLADELGYPPVMLNRLVPELTHRMVENLFASNLEDWSAISRAMRETGEEFRQGKILPLPKSGLASGQ